MVPHSLQKMVMQELRKGLTRSTIIGSWFSLDRTWMLMFSKAAVSVKTLRKALALSTTIVCEDPNRSQISMRAEVKAAAVCPVVGLQMAKAVIPQAAIR